jgi:hypothetical protein
VGGLNPGLPVCGNPCKRAVHAADRKRASARERLRVVRSTASPPGAPGRRLKARHKTAAEAKPPKQRTASVTQREVPALQHELRDDAVELAALVVQGLAAAADALLARGQSAEVLDLQRRATARKFVSSPYSWLRWGEHLPKRSHSAGWINRSSARRHVSAKPPNSSRPHTVLGAVLPNRPNLMRPACRLRRAEPQ